MKKYSKGIVWLRRSLRLEDNKALSEATRDCEIVIVVFIFDSNILNHLKNRDDRRITFIHDSLTEINSQLEVSGSALIKRFGTPQKELLKVASALNAEALYYNEDYEPYAKKRDLGVTEIFKKTGISVHSYKDHVIFSGSEVLKSNGDPYQVFTPYKNAWLKKVTKNEYLSFKRKDNFIEKKALKGLVANLSLEDLGFVRAKIPLSSQLPGRSSALRALKSFNDEINSYADQRDYPYLSKGTSGLSVHLRFGTLSIRECVQLCINNRSKGARTWLSELIWREFYQMILDQYPYVAQSAFKKKYSNIKWSKSKLRLQAWRDGKTGYPIVDAGMRQLEQTGWMHNRVRMITASFLVKDLLIDWKVGEKHFAEKLLDFDLASNNGGWQWSASTGCDAQPYFRIFNPSLQSQRFDPEAKYIKKWVPELSSCTIKEIHNPEKSRLDLKANYPRPVVKHADQKDLAIQKFKKATDV